MIRPKRLGNRDSKMPHFSSREPTFMLMGLGPARHKTEKLKRLGERISSFYLHGKVADACQSDLPVHIAGTFEMRPGEHPCVVLGRYSERVDCLAIVWRSEKVFEWLKEPGVLRGYIVARNDPQELARTREKARNHVNIC